MFLRFCIIFVPLFVGVFSIADRIGCRDEDGKLIDWYYLYKLPSSVESNDINQQKNSGLEYLFITPTTMKKWTLSKLLINETKSMPGQTLSLIYKQNKDNLVLMYNDEPTNGPTDAVRGHTKGVVVANDISGFWLVHSVPKYPPAIDEKEYSYPHTGTMYGQSFLCISFTGDQLGKVGKQLRFNEPRFYSSQVPSHLKTIYPELVRALQMETIVTKPFYNIETLRSRFGTKFLSFAKSGKYDQELYEDFVAPHYAAGDYYVESWRHGAGNIDSDCRQPAKVYNIEEISFANKNLAFKTMHDHSKWLVSVEHNLICVGDINRQEHQKIRGGGTVCQQQPTLSRNYQSLIKDVEKCKTHKKRPFTKRPSKLSNDIRKLRELD